MIIALPISVLIICFTVFCTIVYLSELKREREIRQLSIDMTKDMKIQVVGFPVKEQVAPYPSANPSKMN